MSDGDGYYQFVDIPYGKYLLEVSFMGYNKSQKEVEISQKKQVLDLKLTKKSFELADFEVTAEKELLEESMSKTTVNVSKNNTTSGGNGLDVMLTLASVDLDVNGQIQYRGSNRVTLLINGKPSELVKNLDQIPADQIQKIEIINNPSAKYEADGMSGIINIVLKPNYDEWSRTSLNLYWGTPTNMGGSGGYFTQSTRAKYYINGSVTLKEQFQSKEHWRDNYDDLDAFDYYQYDYQDQHLMNFLLNGGVDYKIHPKHQIGLSLVGSQQLNSADREINYQSLNKEGNTIYNSNKDITISLMNYVIDGNLDYQYQLTKTQKLKAGLHYNYLEQSQEMEFDAYPIASSHYLEHNYQNTYSDQLNKSLDFNLDYSWNISDSSILESGYRYTREDLLNDFRSETYDFDNETWLPDTALANQFHYLQNIQALYINFESQLKYFHIQMGLRGEYTTTDQFIKANETYFDLFPSLMLSKRLDKYFSVFVSYNRRINRPILKMINPYTNEYADVLNMHIGNPDLKPEYVNSLELGSRFSAEKSSIKVSAYYRHINQAISRVKSATNDSALLVTFMNLDHANLLGGELSFSVYAFKWWQINTNANLFYTKLIGAYGPNTINRSHTAWTGSFNNQFKLPWNLQMQLNFYYKSELPDVLGTYMERYYADLAISKKVLQNKGKFIFKISDVFNTYRYGLDLVGLDENGNHYSQKNRRKNESQYFILSFVYNFQGKEKKKKENYYLEEFGK
jgi:outer membrane receptor for ferrienterochelin and colicin